MAIAYAQQSTNHDLEVAETKVKKPHGDYGDSGHYGGSGYGVQGSSGGTVYNFVWLFKLE